MRPILTPALLGLFLVGSAAAQEAASSIYESTAAPKPAGQIDRIVYAKLASMNIQPVLCSDAVFLRRATMDIIGTLPTAEEARAFIDDRDTANKRTALVDQLMQRSEFADYWSMKWGDVLRIKAEFPVNLWPNAAQAYHRWVRASIAENKPYDQFARELLTSSGSNFRVGPVNFYRAIQSKTPESITTAVALTLMGSRTDSWPEGRLEQVSAFFSQVGYKPSAEWKEEIVFWDPLLASRAAGNVAPGQAEIRTSAPPATDGEGDEDADPTGPQTAVGPLTATFPDGKQIELAPGRDPREVFADWLITPENPWFTRSIVNRVWAWLRGRGIIHEPDDIRDDNPPSNPELLAYLEKELIDSGYDLRHLYRLILTSQVYQFSAVPRFNTPQAEAQFASYPLRRLDAEILIDAINTITGTTDLYTSPIPEPFTYIPQDMPAIAVADGSITSPFLALCGRSARATGMWNERNNIPVSEQWLHMLNSSHIQQKLDQGPKLRAIIDARRKPEETAEELYLTILSRRPTEDEIKNVLAYGVAPGRLNRTNWIDVAWSLINSTEFLYRH